MAYDYSRALDDSVQVHDCSYQGFVSQSSSVRKVVDQLANFFERNGRPVRVIELRDESREPVFRELLCVLEVLFVRLYYSL